MVFSNAVYSAFSLLWQLTLETYVRTALKEAMQMLKVIAFTVGFHLGLYKFREMLYSLSEA
jgi:hypothetical protein